MLRRSAKSFLTWLLAITFGGLSFFGDGLHDLLGLHHHGSAVPVCASAVYGFSHGDFLQNGHSRLVAANHREGLHDGATCPICNYLAQGKIIGERFAAISVTASVPNRSPAIPLFAPCPFSSHFSASASGCLALLTDSRSVFDLAHCQVVLFRVRWLTRGRSVIRVRRGCLRPRRSGDKTKCSCPRAA